MVKICRTTTWLTRNRSRKKMTATRWTSCSVNWRHTVSVCHQIVTLLLITTDDVDDDCNKEAKTLRGLFASHSCRQSQWHCCWQCLMCDKKVKMSKNLSYGACTLILVVSQNHVSFNTTWLWCCEPQFVAKIVLQGNLLIFKRLTLR